MKDKLTLEETAAFARTRLDIPGEFNDFEAVFVLLCKGVKLYVEEWERQDLERADRNAEVPAEERVNALADFSPMTRLEMTLEAIQDNL